MPKTFQCQAPFCTAPAGGFLVLIATTSTPFDPKASDPIELLTAFIVQSGCGVDNNVIDFPIAISILGQPKSMSVIVVVH